MKDEVINFQTSNGNKYRFLWQEKGIILILGNYRSIEEIIKNKADVSIPFKKKYTAQDDGKVTVRYTQELDWSEVKIEGIQPIKVKNEFAKRGIIQDDGSVVFEVVAKKPVESDDEGTVPQNVKRYLDAYFGFLAFT